jgi:hypothetical protein
VFMNLHLGHSKTRFSLRSGAGDTRDKFIRVRQREQYGRSIGIGDEGMVLTLGSITELAVTEYCRGRVGD